MRAFVRLRSSGGEIRELGPGDVIGRVWSAALTIADPAISEAHALVSLRGSALKLLALRGRFAVDGVPLTEVELVPGLRVSLARDVALEVIDVALPDEVLALEGDGLARQILSGVSSLRVRPRPELIPGVVADADLTIWSDGLDWLARDHAGEVRPIVAGDRLSVHGSALRFVGVPLGAAGQPATLAGHAGEAPLELVVRFDTVHIHRPDEPSVALDGLSARILSELATIRLPVSWSAIARELWPDDDDEVALRRRWDTAISRLRRKLRDHHIRPDLVRADRTGNFEIFLQRGDRIEDQT
ncbi:MAG: helix-turn-helix domain-containing protein [Deltaproteobacteria bacterium]|nr:helix-turn-helix domain-containing protein [Deltaproteobacteria bacterium]